MYTFEELRRQIIKLPPNSQSSWTCEVSIMLAEKQAKFIKEIMEVRFSMMVATNAS
jgi:hypothetical protein